MRKVLFPGTFDPIHYGHIDIATRAANLFDQVVVAVYDKPLKSLLFSPEQRIEMAKAAFNGIGNINVVGYSGLTVVFASEIGANAIVRGLRVFSDFEYEFRMALANHRIEPEVEVMALITSEEHTFLSSSTVREISSLGGNVSTMVPEHVKIALDAKFNTPGNDQRVIPSHSIRD